MKNKKDYQLTDKGYAYRYPRAAVTADSVIFGFDGRRLQVLLIQRGIEPYKGYWALPGGFMNMDESIDECAFRELREETTLEPEQMEQFGVFSSVDRDPRGRVMTVAFYALVKKSNVRGGDDAQDAQWFDIDQLPRLAFDHREIIAEGLNALSRDIRFEPVGFRLLADEFSMPQLQRLYEAILGMNFDRRNFQKKMLASGIIQPIGSKEKGEKGRGGNLYHFDQTGYEELKHNTPLRSEF